ncbi:putative Fructose-bisphosphate aldolase class 2 [Vibrio nigripulchritudo SFn27]|uniref:Putative Fructose-bisphosphate aldolase class 2 n=1 Tax=Vibrio nigripulchritudo TaxID=28173 RepID=U4K289_9VIBR|nr:class II fructose-bisphosphate aldolase [Vibrio nigripulchritudo]CCN83176.1 putative Fructose-bisphosphate aldolase class 2 [Vibrio nigripulchritudo BLFn1]CCN88641.1 putative Fructose-bisphosphate aldolase class 2 [Vibrio nigripulchritudo SFn27]CCN92780.1 putative Fructose-bisphosphate aldolase class 2 [Vibrio nigripulchritudo ENn2]CCO40366.1 putative Fructose-bisphosphate aldolase class 2 [Vibrio nigripulchritudo SFn135]CCO52650.1 putative Fructose-bisphosphate aldolase class 2 [Vibrio nig
MPLISMKPMLQDAKRDGYGIAAFNIIDYNSARSVITAAQDLNSPVIVQLSVKTIRLWGYDAIASWVKSLAQNVDVPVALHLDHCADLEVIQRCIDAGWTSVMFDGSDMPFEENLTMSLKAYKLATEANVGLEAELGAIGGVEDDKVVSQEHAMLADYQECLQFCAEMPELAAFAPAIGTAHGQYKGEPVIAYDLLENITENIDIPIALHGGTGLADAQFERCIQSGCAKVNISTMHKHQFIEGFVTLALQKPGIKEPIPYIEAQYQTLKEGVELMMSKFGSQQRAESWTH